MHYYWENNNYSSVVATGKERGRTTKLWTMGARTPISAPSQWTLVRAECVRCPWAAGRNVGGHYKWHLYSMP